MSRFSLLLAAAAVFQSSVLLRQLSLAEMRQETSDPRLPTLVVLYDEQGANSQLVAPIIEKVAENYQSLLEFLAVDCTHDEKTCPSSVKERLPALTAYIPAGWNPYTGKEWVKRKDYKGEISPKALSEFLLDAQVFIGAVVDSQSALREFLSDAQRPKVILFTDKPTISPLFQSASALFRYRLDFAVVWKNQTEIAREYAVSSFPRILLSHSSGLKEYTGGAHFSEFRKFLSEFALPSRVYPQLRTPSAGDTERETKFEAVETTEAGLESALEDSKQLAVAMFYGETKAQEWDFLTEKLSGIVLLLQVHCKSVSGVRKYGVSKLPSLRVFPSSRKRVSFSLPLDDSLESELLKELKGALPSLTDASINTFVERVKDDSAIGCLFFSDKPPSLAIKAIASDAFFAEAITFALFPRRNTEILQRIRAKRFPTLTCFVVLNEKGEMRVAEFEGKWEKYGEMHYFLEKVALPGLGKVPLPRKEMEVEDVQQWDADSFEEDCVEQGGFCVLAFFDGFASHPRNAKSYGELQSLQSAILSKHLPFRFGWLNGQCHYDMMTSFGISEVLLPNLAVYVPGKQRAVNLVGTFQYEDMKRLLERVFGGRMQAYSIEKPDFTRSECGVGSRENSDSGDKDIVDAVLAEDEQRKKEIGAGVSSAKKPKKKKKAREKSEL